MSKRIETDQRRHYRVSRITSSWIFQFLVAILVIVAVFLHPPSMFKGDTDTARNYLNTIVSSLSTILALCISIILVAIQMTAANYTHRVLDFFVRLPYNAPLFLVFLVTIMHSFFLMARIRDPERDPLPTPLQPEMSADLVLVVMCFLSLLIYMYMVVRLLKPERIIQLILREYDTSIRKGHWSAALQNIEQICDIIKRATSVNDSLTGTYGLECMHNIAAQLPMPVNETDPVLMVHRSFLGQWGEIIGLTVKEKETGVLYTAFDALYLQGCQYIEMEAWIPAQEVVKTYRFVVFSHLLPEGQEYYAETVAKRLYELADAASRKSERGVQFAIRTLDVVGSCGEHCFRLGKAYETLYRNFLMIDNIVNLLIRLAPTAYFGDAILAYFSLFRTFASVASRKNLSDWSGWWASQNWPSELYQEGRILALELVIHEGRTDAIDVVKNRLPIDRAVTMEEYLSVNDVSNWKRSESYLTVTDTLFDGVSAAARMKSMRAAFDE